MGSSAVIEDFALTVFGRTGTENCVCLPGDVLVGRLDVRILQHIALTCRWYIFIVFVVFALW